jgi:hypothetical protein
VNVFILKCPNGVFVKSPTLEYIKAILCDPPGAGDIGDIGGLTILWGSDYLEQGMRVINLSTLSPHSRLYFYLGIRKYAMVFYSDSRLELFREVIGPGHHFPTEVFYADDGGGCDVALDKANLLTIEEALAITKEFLGSEGRLDLARWRREPD